MVGKNRHRRKLTDEDVVSIIDEYSSGGMCQRELGEKYGVSQGAIYFIVNKINYKYL
jgi:hypothetical protein